MPTIHIRVSEELLARLDEQAATDGRTRAAMAERLLAGALGDAMPMKRIPRITNGKVEKPMVEGLVERIRDKTLDVIEGKRIRPTDMCPHLKEYRHCMLAVCKQALSSPLENGG